MAVPVRAELMASLADLGSRKLACWRRNVDRYRKELRLLARALPALDDLLAVPRQRLDACAGRLPRALRANAQIHHTQLTRAASRLSPRLLAHRIERCREQTAAFGDRARRAFRILRDRRIARLRSAGQLLAAYSYRGVLARGFALVRDGDGRPLRTAAAVGSGMRLDIEFSDGRVGATADGEGTAPPAKPKPRSRGGGGSGGQGSLFGA
jgi:exodeoxyribonuclease VII large subunit